MKPACSNLYNRSKEEIVRHYPCFKEYFERVENSIPEDPLAANEKTITYGITAEDQIIYIFTKFHDFINYF